MLNLNIPLAISAAVAIGLHLLILIVLCFSLSFASLPATQKKLLVTTVRLHPEKQKIAAAISQAPVKTQQNLPKKSITPAKAEPKKEKPIKKQNQAAKVQEKTKDKPTQQKNAASNLLAKAEESLKKIKKEPMAAPLPESKSITAEQEFEAAYRDELAVLLKLLLRLPELGDLNLKLTIAKDGSIKALEILSSESSSNRKYVEKTLPQHTMPPLGKQFGNADSYTFTVTMKGV